MKKVGWKKIDWKTFFWVIMMLFWTFVTLIGSEFLVAFIITHTLPANILNSPLANAGFSIVAYLLTALLVIFLPTKIPKVRDTIKITKERLGIRGLPTWTDIGLAPVGYIATILIVMGLTLIFENFDWFNSNQTQELGYSIYMQGWERGIAFIELAIIAPIMEELIFRGWLYGNLRVKVPKPLAIFLVSLLFGIVHMQWNVGITVFAMSIITCVLREVTGSIYAGTLVHIINNSVAFYLLYVAGMMA